MPTPEQGPNPALDLSQCEREPVHIPGAIQPHGALLVVDPARLSIICVSDNVEAILGVAPGDLLGHSLASLAGVAGLGELVEGLLAEDVTERGSFPLTVASGERRIAIAHRHGGRLIVECEAESSDPDFELAYFYNRVRGGVVRLRETSNLQRLCEQASQELRLLTGFDRVLVYRFNEDWSGEVLAEASATGSERYLGLRFPASDIPQQARALYTVCRLRAVPTSVYEPSRLVGLRGDEVVDLTHAVLRSISPIHLQYMRNMGVTASLGISLIHEGRLWGLITCNHESGQRFIPHQARSACALLGEIMSSLIGEKQRLLESEQRVAFLRTQAQLVQFIAQERDVGRGLTQHVPSLPDVTRSSAAAFCNEQGIHRVGNAPAELAIAGLLKWLVQRGATPVVADSLPELYPAAHAWKDVGCGLLAARVDCGSAGMLIQPSWLLWFRPEVAQTVAWGGDPSKPVLSGESSGPLTPRTSFELWKEDVHLKSTPFRAEDVAAAESLARALGHVILEIEVNRQISQKALLLAESNRQLRDQIAETERVEIELRRAQKLEAVGRLAAGVAHEINTPLQFVSDGVHFLKDATSALISLVSSLEPSPGAREAADFDYLELEVPKTVTRSMEGLGRVAAIVQAMKEFAHPDGAEKSLADINRTLTVTVEVAQGELNKVAAVTLELGNLPMIACYLGDLKQVFLGLLVNAADAIAPTLNATRARGLISVKSWCAPPDVWVSVTDDGIGIPESNRERVFLPFFTTHPEGHGTGQGLAIAHAIVVNQHGGSLDFESELGKGTTFTVRLPMVPRS